MACDFGTENTGKLSNITILKNHREVAEWSKAHAWKVCKPKGFEGSNPFLSANDKAPI